MAMEQLDTQEAVPICQRVLTYLLGAAPTRGRPGSDLRTAVGDFLGYAYTLIRNDLAGPPLSDIFDLARATGVTQAQLAATRATASTETPQTLGGKLIQNSLIGYLLAAEARIVADMTFVSRNDVNTMLAQMNAAFTPMEEIAADDMDQSAFSGLVALHAAISYHLALTAIPLPRVLQFTFAQSMPTLVTAYRLYADASRADELRVGNKVVHPAFERPYGEALAT